MYLIPSELVLGLPQLYPTQTPNPKIPHLVRGLLKNILEIDGAVIGASYRTLDQGERVDGIRAIAPSISCEL